MTENFSPRQTTTPRHDARRRTRSLLAGTAITMLMASGAFAASTIVVPDGAVVNKVLLTVDGDTLIVEQGGRVENAADSPVEADGGGGNIGVIIRNDGVIEGLGNNPGIYTLNGADIISLVNTGLIVGEIGVFAQSNNIHDLNNSGFISGDTYGIFLSGDDLIDAINSGAIFGNGIGIGVGVGDIVGLRNQGEIGGADYGIEVDTGDVSGVNFGQIIGTNGSGSGVAGIRINFGNLNDFVNQAGGLIRGGQHGVYLFQGDLVSMQNFGEISGRDGVGSGITGILVLNGELVNLVNADSGTIIGDRTGISVAGGGIRGFVNSGRVSGLTRAGIYVNGAAIEDVVNMAGGTIGGVLYGVELDNNGTFSNFTNAGTIAGGEMGVRLSLGSDATGFVNEATGVITGGLDGVRTFDAGLVDSANHGTISGTANGLAISRDLTNFTNSGTIMASATGPLNPEAVYAVNIENLINNGTILAQSDGPVEGTAIRASDRIFSLTNSGWIFAPQFGNSYAIIEDGGGDTDLTLLPGSVIQGLIDIEGGGGNDRLFVGPGLNLATTFETSLPEEIETYGVLMATDAATGLVAVADTSALAASDNAIADVTSAVSRLFGSELESGVLPSQRNVWIKGFGNYSQIGAQGAALDVDHRF